MDVLMFMHPFVLIFMLFWLSSLGFTAWKQFPLQVSRPHPASYIPVGMFIFGLALSIGSFAAEAVKAKHLLTAAILDPAITSSVGVAQ